MFVFLATIFLTIMPPTLQKGDTIGIIAPAKFTDKKETGRVVAALKKEGYQVKLASNLEKRRGYLAGDDLSRAKAFMEIWADPKVKMVWCIRGGYGCTRIINMLDYNFIRTHPKIFVGMSDVTALHAAIQRRTGLITYLGPVASQLYGKDEQSAYSQKMFWETINNPPQGRPYPVPEGFKMRTMRPGVTQGELVGGCLSLITALIGTPDEIDTTGKILLLEDVYEEPFRIDRQLQQLKQSGALDAPAAVILCSWHGCRAELPEHALTLNQVLNDYFGKASYPVLSGFPAGHILHQATLPLGRRAEVDTQKKTLKLLQD